MLVVSRHNYKFCQPVEPLSGTGNLPSTPKELLTRVVNCAARSSLVAEEDVRQALILLPDGDFYSASIETKNLAARDDVLSILRARDISCQADLDNPQLILADIHLPLFLQLCRDERVISVTKAPSTPPLPPSQ